MARLAPLRLRLVRPEWSDRVPAPAHDALTPGERSVYLRRHPDSYLAVTKGAEDFLDGLAPSAHELVAGGRRALDRLLLAGAFTDLAPARLYAYQLEAAGWSQVGIVGGIHLDEYDSGTIRIHEHIHETRAEHLALHAEIVAAQSSPVALAHHPDSELARILERVEDDRPTLDFSAEDGLHQTVWPIDSEGADAIITGLAGHRLYLVDGHHRTAAASIHRRRGGSDWLLAALFSTDQLQSRAFHRLVTTHHESPLRAIASRLADTRIGRIGDGSGAIHLYQRGNWLTIPHVPAHRPLERLDTWQFEHHVLPALGPDAIVRYRNARTSETDLIAEADRTGELVAFMSAVTMPQLFAVADAGDVMPPKSTYFEPKVRSGVFLRHLDHDPETP